LSATKEKDIHDKKKKKKKKEKKEKANKALRFVAKQSKSHSDVSPFTGPQDS